MKDKSKKKKTQSLILTQGTVNKKPIKIYIWDTKIDIINRIAYLTGSLPEYVLFRGLAEDITEKTKIQITSESLLDIAKELAKEEMSMFSSFYQDQEVKDKTNLSLKNLLKIWIIAKNGNFGGYMGSFDKLLMTQIIQDDININQDNPINIDDMIRDSKYIIEEYETRLQKFNNLEQIKIQSIDELEKAKPQPSTKFELVTKTVENTLKLTNGNLYDIFNGIILRNEIPFASINNFFKIYTKLIPNEEWIVSKPDKILLKSYDTDSYDEKESTKDHFSNIYITLNTENKVILTYSIYQDPRNHIKIKTLRERISDTLNLGNIWNTKKKGKTKYINGVFYFPGMSFNKFVFADLAMNDPVFSNFIKINEKGKASKMTEGVYLYFYDSKLNEIAATLTVKTMDKTDVTMKQHKESIKEGTQYVRVKISRAKNLRSIREFESILSKLMSLYKKKQADVIKYYKQFIPKFGDVPKDKKHKRNKEDEEDPNLKILRTEWPDLFISGYSRANPCYRNLKIVDTKDSNLSPSKIMQYPRQEDENQQRSYFICDPNLSSSKNKKKIYPGVKENKLANQKKYPYVPCCYPTDQKKGKAYKEYFEGIKKMQKRFERIWSSNKRMPLSARAFLPDNLAKLFCALDPNYTYWREGTIDSPNSAIHCLEKVFGIQILHEKEKSLPNLSKHIDNQREQFDNDKVSICKQEMYSYTIEEIKKYIADNDLYFDPKKFIRLLENFYNCNIYIFRREKDETDAEIVIPDHTHAYYVYKRERPTVILFEHWGSDIDSQNYPQCELIVRYDSARSKRDNNITMDFEYNTEFLDKIRYLFNEKNKTYILNREILPINYFDPQEIGIVGQYIDNYGKCRFLKIQFEKGQYLYMMTTPIPPLSVDEIPLIECLGTNDLKMVHSFLKKNKEKIISQMNWSGERIELTANINGIKVTFLASSSEVKEVVDTSDCSVIHKYRQNKNISTSLKSYLFYIFSIYVKDQKLKLDNLDIQSIIIFVQNKIAQNDAYVYFPVEYSLPSEKDISKVTNGLMTEGKLIVTSIELLKRLIYTLRLEIERNQSKIQNYHTNRYVENYFEDVSDFKIIPNQIVLQGKDSVLNWEKELTSKFILSNKIEPRNTHPYFIANDIMTEGNVMLAQNTDSFSNALSIGDIWNKNGYNASTEESIEEGNVPTKSEITLYSYENSDNIIEIRKNSSDIIIAGYKVDQKNRFTDLLKLSN